MDAKKAILPLHVLANGGRTIASGATLAHAYENGVRTERIIGLKVTVVFPDNGYEKQVVTVDSTVDSITPALEKADGPLYVDFEGFQARFYVMNGKAGISAKAKAVKILDAGKDEIDF